ncbi:unnamed protein product, partial [Polarella glacialis]
DVKIQTTASALTEQMEGKSMEWGQNESFEHFEKLMLVTHAMLEPVEDDGSGEGDLELTEFCIPLPAKPQAESDSKVPSLLRAMRPKEAIGDLSPEAEFAQLLGLENAIAVRELHLESRSQHAELQVELLDLRAE